MPWVVRDAVRDINRMVGRRWQAIDPLLPDPGGAAERAAARPLVVNGDNGRMAGLGVCVHHHVPAGSLNQTWGAADRFTLVPRLAGQDVGRRRTCCSRSGASTWPRSARRAGRTRRRASSGPAWTSPGSARCSGTGCSR